MWRVGETYILNAVCVCLVLHDGVGWKVEDPAQRVADAGRGRLVTGGFVPDGDDVLLRMTTNDDVSASYDSTR